MLCKKSSGNVYSLRNFLASFLFSDQSRPITHPSPPQTPPGSSIRQSPPTLPSVDQDNLDGDEDDRSANGHVTRISMKSPTGIKDERFMKLEITEEN